MTSAHDLAVNLEALIKSYSNQPSVMVISPDCLQIDFHGFVGMPTAWLIAAIRTAGWHVSIDNSARGTFSLTLEPTVQHPQRIPSTLFHATPEANLRSMKAAGITPSAKAGTWTGRSYPTPRSFFATQKWDAFVYIASHEAKGPVQHGLPALEQGVLETWELLAVINTPGHNFYRDAIMPPSVWTDATIPASSLARVEGWRQEYMQAVEWSVLNLAGL